MERTMRNFIAFFAASVSLLLIVPATAFAGKPQKWDELPKAVQETVLANGGSKNDQVDKESEQVDGQALYEAPVKDKDGNAIDLQILADGRLLEVKTDDSPEEARQRVERGNKVLASAK